MVNGDNKIRFCGFLADFHWWVGFATMDKEDIADYESEILLHLRLTENLLHQTYRIIFDKPQKNYFFSSD